MVKFALKFLCRFFAKRIYISPLPPWR